MHIKKSLLLLLTVVLVFACKQEEMLDQNSGQTAGLTADISQYDNSNIGLYKGTFTTLDATERGIVEVTILDNAPSRATLTLVSGASFILISTTNATASQVVTNLHFTASPEAETATTVAFDFSVNDDGSDPRMNNITLGGNESSIIIAKETSRGPVNPVTGTYVCTTCGTHPTLGTTPETYNALFAVDGTGDDTMTTDITVGGSNYVSTSNTQSSCNADTPAVGYTTCNISGSTTIGNTMTWSGTHTYDQSATLCSEAAGTWAINGTPHGDLAGIFIADAQCIPVSLTCSNATDLPQATTDNDCTVSSNATNAVIGIIGTNIAIESVTLDITHTWDGDLSITLTAPNGSTSLDLSSNNGGSGDNYTNTVFQDGGADIVIVGAPPYDFATYGAFQPEGGTFAAAFVGVAATGDWNLEVCDNAGGDGGSLDSFQICFTAQPPPAPLTTDVVHETRLVAKPSYKNLGITEEQYMQTLTEARALLANGKSTSLSDIMRKILAVEGISIQ